MADMEDLADLLKTMLSSDSPEMPEDTADEENESDGTGDFFSGIDFDMIMKMGSVMSKMQEQDKNTALLTALKPHMRNENQAKIDTAIRLVRIMGLMPMIKDLGLMDKLF